MNNDPTPDNLPDQIQALKASLSELETRVRLLEAHLVPENHPSRPPLAAATADQKPAADIPFQPPSVPSADFNHLLALTGRSIMILAIAFLLRFAADTKTIPPALGAALGVALGIILILLVPRAMRKNDRSGAFAYGLTAVVIAFPLIFETVATLKIIPGVVGAFFLVLVTATGLIVAWRDHLRGLAWVFTLAALALIFALLNRSGQDAVLILILLALGAVTSLLAYSRGWHLLRWAAASALGLVLLRTILLASDAAPEAGGGLQPGSVQILCLIYMLVYLLIFGWRALVKGRGVKVFDIVQSAAVVGIGFGGIIRIARAEASGTGLIGGLALLGAVAGYTIAFTVVSSRHGRGRAFFYFATLALVFLFLGSLVIAHGPWLTWFWLGLGLAASALGGHFRRVTLRYHAAVYMAMAAVQSGLLLSALKAFLQPPDSQWPSFSTAAALSFLAATAAYAVLTLTQRGRDIPFARRLPRLVLASILLAGAGYLAVMILAAVLTGLPPAADPARLALGRTLVVSVTAILLAWLSRRLHLSELGWLVYPVLLFGCAKLLLEDMEAGTAFTLALSFAALGGALVLSPRLLLAGSSGKRPPMAET